MNTSDKVDKLYAAIAKAQAMIGGAKADRTNGHLGNRYATLDSVMAAAKPGMVAAGLGVVQEPSLVGQEVIVATTLVHSSGQWLSIETRLPMFQSKGVNVAQAAGGVITYARRYALLAVLGIAGDPADDTDGEPPKAKKTRAKKKTNTAAPKSTAKPGSHPSWESDRKAYFAALAGLHLNAKPEEVADWKQSTEGQRPREMDNQGRRDTIGWLRTSTGKEQLYMWLESEKTHKSWTPNEEEGFRDGLKRFKLKYDDLANYLVGNNKRRPSEMDILTRKKLWVWMADGDGLEKVFEWLGKQDDEERAKASE